MSCFQFVKWNLKQLCPLYCFIGVSLSNISSHPKLFLKVIFPCGNDPVSQLRWTNFGNHKQEKYFKIKHFSFLVSASKLVNVLNPRGTKCSINTKSPERKLLNILVFDMKYFIPFFTFLPKIPFGSDSKINFEYWTLENWKHMA